MSEEEYGYIQVVYEDNNTILISSLDDDIFNEEEYSKEYRSSIKARVVRADKLLWQQILWLKRQSTKNIQTVIDPNYDAPVSLTQYIEDSIECLKRQN